MGKRKLALTDETNAPARKAPRYSPDGRRGGGKSSRRSARIAAEESASYTNEAVTASQSQDLDHDSDGLGRITLRREEIQKGHTIQPSEVSILSNKSMLETAAQLSGNDDKTYPSSQHDGMSTNSQDTSYPSISLEANARCHIHEVKGDIFSSPPQSVLIHACNTEGSWGAGIALAFRTHYPRAFCVYLQHCKAHKDRKTELAGTALLIPSILQFQTKLSPSKTKSDRSSLSASSKRHQGKTGELDEDINGHFIGCLFTSVSKGRNRDSPATILQNTGPAMLDLLQQIEAWNSSALAAAAAFEMDNSSGEETKDVTNHESLTASEKTSITTGQLIMCKINSGLFSVPWAKTRQVIEGMHVPFDLRTVDPRSTLRLSCGNEPNSGQDDEDEAEQVHEKNTLHIKVIDR